MNWMATTATLFAFAIAGCGGGYGDESPTPETAAPPPPAATAPATVGSAPANATLVSLTDQRVEVGCGMCVYGIEGVDRCELAVKVDGTPYRAVGDAAAPHGHAFCGGAGTAIVSGKTENGVFTATKVVLD